MSNNSQQILSASLFIAALFVAIFMSLQWGILIMLMALYAKPTPQPKVNIQPQVTRTVVVPGEPAEKE